jgi:DNA repair exonuclease SbcCD ATPase subunit
MTQILKRLEIIKSSIAIEELEIIELQIAKLQTLGIDEDVLHIIQNLEDGAYSTAETLIQNYLARFGGVVIYEDSELTSLKLELKSLESKLQNLIEEKTEYLNDIEEFNNEYNLRLGELIRAILNLKKEILYKQTIKQVRIKEKYKEDLQTFEETKETIEELKNTIAELEEALKNIDEEDEEYEELTKAHKELQEEIEVLEKELENQEEELEKTKEFIEDETIEEEYEEAKANFDEYENEYEQTKENQKDVMQLSDDEKAELKKLFRETARLCHPDIVPDEFKEKATQMMQQLNDAYSKKDLKKIKEILSSLENGTVFEITSDKLEDKIKLQEKINEYKQNIKDIEDEIARIVEDDTYQTVSGLDDWDGYFEELKSDLEAQKEELEEEAGEILDN